MLYVMCAISSNYYGSVQLRSVSDSGCNWNLHRKIVLWEFWVVSCINVVRRFSWLSNFQLNNLHNVCVSRVNGEESEQFAKYFSFRIIINSAMIKFSLSCEMVLVNINIYTPSVICRFMVEGGRMFLQLLTCQVWAVQSEHLFFPQQQDLVCLLRGCCQKLDCTKH